MWYLAALVLFAIAQIALGLIIARRVKGARSIIPRSSSTPSAQRSRPPVFIGNLFGLAATRLTTAKSEGVLGWKPRINLNAGQTLARAWLAEMGLLSPQSSAETVVDRRFVG